MVQVKIEDIIDHLSTEMKAALEDAVKKTIPNASIDKDKLFAEFKKSVYRKCSTWETVPATCVKA